MGKMQDWWRGWSDEDRASVIGKLSEDHKPGSVIPLSAREMRALHALDNPPMSGRRPTKIEEPAIGQSAIGSKEGRK